MMFPEPRFIDTNGIRMAIYERGHGPAVILLHGFPELAFSWRHQLPALAAAGYRAWHVGSRSELSVLRRGDEDMLGQIDIGSDAPNGFDGMERAAVKEVADALAVLL